MDFGKNFNTALNAENEKKYRAWLTRQAATRGRDFDLTSRDYDLRGYWLNGGWKDTGTGHMPDTYKKPNHPTFSEESVYHGTPAPGGRIWAGGRWGRGTFVPSREMFANGTHTMDQMKRYFAAYEPDTILLPPLER